MLGGTSYLLFSGLCALHRTAYTPSDSRKFFRLDCVSERDPGHPIHWFLEYYRKIVLGTQTSGSGNDGATPVLDKIDMDPVGLWGVLSSIMCGSVWAWAHRATRFVASSYYPQLVLYNVQSPTPCVSLR